MLLIGFTMALTPLQWSSQPVVHSIGHLFDMVPAAMFLHLFLAFPTGRLTRRAERWIVGSCYAVTLVLQLIKIMLGVNPDSVFVVTDQAEPGTWSKASSSAWSRSACWPGWSCCIAVGAGRVGPRDVPRRWWWTPSASPCSCWRCCTSPASSPGRTSRSSGLITFAALGLAPLAFLFALLDMRLARGDAAGLLVELRNDPTIDLQAPLARALRDPTLRLYYWLPELGTWADQHGEPTAAAAAGRLPGRPGAAAGPGADGRPELRPHARGGARTPRRRGGDRRYRPGERPVAGRAPGPAARSPGVEGPLLEAGRQERQRLERDLHDGAQVRLVALSLELGLLGAEPGTDPSMKARLCEAKASVSASLQELRDVAHGIYPAVLSGHGLGWRSNPWPPEPPCRSTSTSTCPNARPRPSRSRSTTWSARHSPTSASIRPPPGPGPRPALGPVDHGRHQRRRHRASPSPARGRACAGWPIGSRPSAVASGSADGRRWARAAGCACPCAPTPLTVAIAEDSVLLREGLTRILTGAGLHVDRRVRQCRRPAELVAGQPPDIVIVDIRLPPTHTDEGMRAALRIRHDHPDAAVLVLSQYVELGLALQLLSESAEKVGYLLKDRISDVGNSSTPSAGSPVAGPRSIPRSSRRCCAGGAVTTRWTG